MRVKRVLCWSAGSILLLASLVVVYFATFSLYTKYVSPYSAAFNASATAAQLPPTPEARSRFRLLTGNNDALMSRIVLADRAARTLDLEYYIFDADGTGSYVAQHLLAAADRGVRVRLLVDDLDAGDADRMLGRLDAHANIEVRLFNPFRTRNPSLISKLVQFVIDGRRLNRRMHNKAFVADNAVAIVGGRNIGDAYFEDGDTAHFRDLDVIATGAVVPQVTRSFETYWNAPAAHPITESEQNASSAEDLAQWRPLLAGRARASAQSEYAQSLPDALPGGKGENRPGQWRFGRATVVADAPRKVDDPDAAAAQAPGPQLDALIGGAREEVLLISAYFVPGDEDAQFFAALAQRGVKVKVLTNSLAATDEPMVYAGYAGYRHQLLAGGVELYELRPSVAKQPSAHGKSSGVSLHAKAIVVDRRYVFVGSLNLDLRSKLLNTEMGLVADSPELAADVRDYFERAARADNAYRVALDADGSLVWQAVEDGRKVVFTHEPDVSIWRRGRVDLLRLLPMDSLL